MAIKQIAIAVVAQRRNILAPRLICGSEAACQGWSGRDDGDDESGMSLPSSWQDAEQECSIELMDIIPVQIVQATADGLPAVPSPRCWAGRNSAGAARRRKSSRGMGRGLAFQSASSRRPQTPIGSWPLVEKYSISPWKSNRVGYHRVFR